LQTVAFRQEYRRIPTGHCAGSAVKLVPSESPSQKPFAFLTLPQYSMIALTSAISAPYGEQHQRTIAYEWSIVSLDGAFSPATA
jgi:hypothetical protein